MPTLTYQELGLRLKAARDAVGLTQEQVAEHLKLPRVSISQIESGQRRVSTLELVEMARLYGRDISSFLADQPVEQGTLAALFRANPELAQDDLRRTALQDAFELCREYANLKKLLGMDEERHAPPAYTSKDPRNTWEAIQMGERVAEQERSRLNLGTDPIKSMAEIVESQGVPIISRANLDEEISGIFIADAELGPCIFVNQTHLQYAKARAAFTIAHEYCHVLLDRDKISTISKTSNARDIPEVRANAFAAAFLMPEEGVRQFLQNLGKGESSRETLVAYANGEEPVVGQHRRLASSQALTLYDIVQLQNHFGTSFESTMYRLKNLKILAEEEWQQFFNRKEEARQLASFFLPRVKGEARAKEEEGAISSFVISFLGMAIEAYRRDEITYSKLLELGQKVGLDTETIEQILKWMGMEEDSESGVL